MTMDQNIRNQSLYMMYDLCIFVAHITSIYVVLPDGKEIIFMSTRQRANWAATLLPDSTLLIHIFSCKILLL